MASQMTSKIVITLITGLRPDRHAMIPCLPQDGVRHGEQHIQIRGAAAVAREFEPVRIRDGRDFHPLGDSAGAPGDDAFFTSLDSSQDDVWGDRCRSG